MRPGHKQKQSHENPQEVTGKGIAILERVIMGDERV